MDPGHRLLGPCPLCGRPLLDGPSVDLHHWRPKSEGGRVAEPLHRICHQKIHTVFSERELAEVYFHPEVLRRDPEIQKFINWVRRMPSEYIGKNHPLRARATRRRRIL